MTGSPQRPAGPTRQCVACRRRVPAGRLLRFCAGPRHQVRLDLLRRAGGRGVHTCANSGCLRAAATRGSFSRGLKEPVSCRPDAVAAEVATALLQAGEALALRLWRRRPAAACAGTPLMLLVAGAPDVELQRAAEERCAVVVRVPAQPGEAGEGVWVSGAQAERLGWLLEGAANLRAVAVSAAAPGRRARVETGRSEA